MSEVSEHLTKETYTTTAWAGRPEDDVVCVDLFCGAGELTHGLISAGVKVRAGVAFEEVCRHPYGANHEGIAFHQADIAELVARTVAEWFGDAKVGTKPVTPVPSVASPRYGVNFTDCQTTGPLLSFRTALSPWIPAQ